MRRLRRRTVGVLTGKAVVKSQDRAARDYVGAVQLNWRQAPAFEVALHYGLLNGPSLRAVFVAAFAGIEPDGSTVSPALSVSR